MKSINPDIKSLADFVDYLQSQGEYQFSSNDVFAAMSIRPATFKVAANRLIKQNRIIRLHNSFYSIVPLEYKSAGSLPPSWFIDSLMKFQKQPYYVGLLTAAAIHGASHQQAQVFQVITSKSMRPVLLPRNRIEFITKKNIEHFPTEAIKTPTGSMKVSTPEVTAFDLVRYVTQAGYLNNVVTVLTELVEKIAEERLTNIAPLFEITVTQRLGYLLENFTEISSVESLFQWLKKQKTKMIPLRPDRPIKDCLKNLRWHLFINENIEPDI